MITYNDIIFYYALYIVIGYIFGIACLWKEIIEDIKYSWINIHSDIFVLTIIAFTYPFIIFFLILDYFGLIPYPCIREQ